MLGMRLQACVISQVLLQLSAERSAASASSQPAAAVGPNTAAEAAAQAPGGFIGVGGGSGSSGSSGGSGPSAEAKDRTTPAAAAAVESQVGT